VCVSIAKTLHPDVTGNDAHKAERFKDVSEAHAVLSDAHKRREYDATRPFEGFGPRSTAGETRHPYARAGGEPDLRARPMYGINEEVWLAHHYGPEALRRAARAPPRYYGMNVAEERAEQEEERIRQCVHVLIEVIKRWTDASCCGADGRSTTNCTRQRGTSFGERRGSSGRRKRRPRRRRTARSKGCRPRSREAATAASSAKHDISIEQN